MTDENPYRPRPTLELPAARLVYTKEFCGVVREHPITAFNKSNAAHPQAMTPTTRSPSRDRQARLINGGFPTRTSTSKC